MPVFARRPAAIAAGFSIWLAACAAPEAAGPAMNASPSAERPRARDLGLRFGPFAVGPHNDLTDVAGVRVGHCTRTGDGLNTGVTVILPHGGNPFREKVPAGVHIANGFGKFAGGSQIAELGELESPIALTATLNVPRVANGLLDWLLALPGNEDVRSINAVVGETNDGALSDIRRRAVTAGDVATALAAASDGPVRQGCVGAGAGTVCMGWKGGIGSSSRRVGEHTLGVLVQTNFGGRLTIAGVPVHEHLRPEDHLADRDGSCWIVVATDAPLDAHALQRLAARAFAGMARTGAAFSNGSGDYAIAFCTAPSQRIGHERRTTGGEVLRGDALSPLFLAVADATEEAIVDSLLAAVTTRGAGRTVPALPAASLRELLAKR
jgi:D-aminopeptidase